MDDLIGKGLEPAIIAELMLYASASLVPSSLPLAVLLSSIMTMGNISEKYELAAMKSAGMSLSRITRPLTIFMILLASASLFFSNNILPIANLKFGSLLYDVTNQKPAVEIQEGIFYKGIDKIAIRAAKKDNKTGDLFDVLIYDHTENRGNVKVTTAEKAKINFSANKQYMIIELYNGYSYNEQESKAKNNTVPFLRYSFQEEVIQIDLSDFQLKRTEEELFKDNYQMLNLKQLDAALEKQIQQNHFRNRYAQNVYALNFQFLYHSKDSLDRDTAGIKFAKRFSENYKNKAIKPLDLANFDKKQLLNYYQLSSQNVRSIKVQLETAKMDKEFRMVNRNKHLVEWHKKFTLAVSCLVLFVLGAPLGAIIRKGGLGMPVVVAIFFYLFNYILSITFEKMSKEGSVFPFVGMWLPLLVMLPIGIFLFYKASIDSTLFDFGAYKNLVKLSFWKNLFRFKKLETAAE